MPETEEEKAARLAAEEEANKKLELEVKEPELDDDGNPIVPVIEPWMEEEEAGEQDPDDPSKQVPVGKFVATKRKLKGKISELDDENARLRKERDDALKLKPAEKTALIKPKQDDFDTDELFDAALEKYNDDRAVEVFNRQQLEKDQGDAQVKAKQALTEAVDGHYERAETLIKESKIKPEVYQAADTTVRKAVESVSPNLGDVIVDQVISILGDGSEKVIYYLGRNKAALAKFQSLLSSDPSGMKAAVYLGQEKQRLTKTTNQRSNAPAPASKVKGDEPITGAAGKFHKKYKAAHAKNDTQGAYNAKKEAKAANVDVSSW